MQIAPIKYILDLISHVLTTLCNIVLDSRRFPRNMHNAAVVALYKEGDMDYLNDFRPICALPIFSKGLKKITHTCLYNLLNKFTLISLHQYGFLKGKSTELALLAEKEFIIDAFKHKELMLGLTLIFQKFLALSKTKHYEIG